MPFLPHLVERIEDHWHLEKVDQDGRPSNGGVPLEHALLGKRLYHHLVGNPQDVRPLRVQEDKVAEALPVGPAAQLVDIEQRRGNQRRHFEVVRDERAESHDFGEGKVALPD
jgi:hypothetical protein